MFSEAHVGVNVYLWIWIITFLFSFVIKSPSILQKAHSYNKGRVYFLFSALTLTWLGVLAGLSYLWYNTDAQLGFHWFNDNYGWLQIDKAGHLFAWRTSLFYKIKV